MLNGRSKAIKPYTPGPELSVQQLLSTIDVQKQQLATLRYELHKVAQEKQSLEDDLMHMLLQLHFTT